MIAFDMPHTGAPALEDLLVEFRDLAGQLDMTPAEQADVAGLAMSVGALLSLGVEAIPPAVAARCARRLTYCVPLLRQILRNEGRFASMDAADPPLSRAAFRRFDATSIG